MTHHPQPEEVGDDCPVVETKVVLLGNTGVGKTSLVTQYVKGHFLSAPTTIGASFMVKNVRIGNYKLTLQLWDTAGQERFRSMAPMYYRGADAAILVFDLLEDESLDTVRDWVDELQNHTDVNSNIVLAVAANKSDMLSTPLAENDMYKEAVKYTDEINALLFPTSAKTGAGIEELFSHVSKYLLESKIERPDTQYRDAHGNIIKVTPNSLGKPEPGSGRCCS